MLALFATAAEAQLFIEPNVQVQSNDVVLSVIGLPTNAICDVLFSPKLGSDNVWTLYYRGAAGQTNFLLPAPGTSTGFFRLQSDFLPAPALHPFDWDGDGISNDAEIAAGTDPFSGDSDGDGVADNLDAFPLDPSRSRVLIFDPADHTPPQIILEQPLNAKLLN